MSEKQLNQMEPINAYALSDTIYLRPDTDRFQEDLHEVCSPEFFELVRIKEKIDEVELEKSEIERCPAGAEDFEKRKRSEFRTQRDSRIKTLTRRILDPTYGLAGHPFAENELPPYVSPQEEDACIAKAMDQYRPDNGIKDVERTKQLAKLSSELAILENRKQELSPRKFFVGTVGGQDARFLILDCWRGIQARCSRPCNIGGIDLTICSLEEQKAWKVLGLGKWVNRNTVTIPFSK